ncbi:surface antigen BspA-like [Trichomonas vaginalis G3]|uniref:Surface antigen BspA-like n=1 Tax=Trichomonas vaginalis (strain ATCC PRA-98 / G3) TaxID=412133 RepID=A2FZR6_TRIV3|nr:surface antigen family [Trichomonas vaginalis G3]EAX89606.1 surface antigen BspA-like [Trichomonas vaginalis G3]KAI5512108.1 surface antigen family [Trichomonas vaginalis G3]|eukprot:XP_001302536.1 surface antigen BspA-like [Trichomonas vaginalis G3]
MLPLLISSSRCSVSFSYTDSNKTLVISGDGEFTAADITKIFGDHKNFTHLQIYGAITTIPDLAFNGSEVLTDIVIQAPISKFGIQSFSNCFALQSFTIPETVDSLGNSCFASCTNLKTLQYHVHTMTYGDSAFQGCKNLVSFIQVNNDTSKPIEGMKHSFGQSCFQGCAALTTIALPPNTASMGDSIFQGCTALTSFNSTSDLTELPRLAFKGCNKLHTINIPDVETIGVSAFEDCSSLSAFTFKNIKLIKLYAFKNCKFNSIPLDTFDFKMEGYVFYQNNNLKSFSMPPSMDVVPEFTFYGCGSLDTITYRGNIKTIKNSAFRQANILTFEIPKTCETIEPFVFAEMTRVNGFTIPPENKFFYYDANQKLLYNYDRTKLIHSIWTSNAANLVFDEHLTSIEGWPFTDSNVHTNYTMPSALVSLGDAVFRKNSKLTVLAFPPNLERIPTRCCYQCESLTTVYLGNVKVIGAQAFSYCTKLANIVLPPTLESIENYAFAQCSALTTIEFPKKISEIQFGAFYQCNLQYVDVPDTVKFMPHTVFAKNPNLKSIKFNGA